MKTRFSGGWIHKTVILRRRSNELRIGPVPSTQDKPYRSLFIPKEAIKHDDVQAQPLPASTFAVNGEQSPETDTGATVRTEAFDFASMRLSQNFRAVVGVKRVLTVVPVRKPSKQEFFVRTPNGAMRPMSWNSRRIAKLSWCARLSRLIC